MALRGELSLWDDSFIAEAAVKDRQVVKRGTDKEKALPTAGNNDDGILGVSGQDVDAVGTTFVRVRRLGKAEIVCGGSVSAGDQLVAAAAGKVVKLADVVGELSDGDVVNVVGEAEEDGVLDDVIVIKVHPYTYTLKK
jgi:hypothetical protein